MDRCSTTRSKVWRAVSRSPTTSVCSRIGNSAAPTERAESSATRRARSACAHICMNTPATVTMASPTTTRISIRRTSPEVFSLIVGHSVRYSPVGPADDLVILLGRREEAGELVGFENRRRLRILAHGQQSLTDALDLLGRQARMNQNRQIRIRRRGIDFAVAQPVARSVLAEETGIDADRLDLAGCQLGQRPLLVAGQHFLLGHTGLAQRRLGYGIGDEGVLRRIGDALSVEVFQPAHRTRLKHGQYAKDRGITPTRQHFVNAVEFLPEIVVSKHQA